MKLYGSTDVCAMALTTSNDDFCQSTGSLAAYLSEILINTQRFLLKVIHVYLKIVTTSMYHIASQNFVNIGSSNWPAGNLIGNAQDIYLPLIWVWKWLPAIQDYSSISQGPDKATEYHAYKLEIMHQQHSHHKLIVALWCHIRCHRSWSTLAQAMACCLTAPSHCLNQCWLIIQSAQCWLIIEGVIWHSLENIFTRSAHVLNL